MAMFDVFNATAGEVLLGLESGRLTSKAVVEAHLTQISKTNSRLQAVLEIAPTALSEASERDSERSRGIAHGPLHGLPILIKVCYNGQQFYERLFLILDKGSIATGSDLGMDTISGNFALCGSRPRQNAEVVQRVCLKSTLRPQCP